MTSEQATARAAYVHVWLPGSTTPVVAGRLDEHASGRLDFVYGRSYLSRSDAIPLDPRELPLRRGRARPPLGDLHGVIRDASPDAWGRRVLGYGGGAALSELDYLVGVGPDRIGALAVSWTPAPPEDGHVAEAVTLDDLVRAAERLERGEPLARDLELALRRGTSVGGARPKALIHDGPTRWIAKMSSSTDHYPVVRAEHAAMELARRVGVRVPRVERVQSLGRDVLLVERFDRHPSEAGVTRRLMLSALSVLQLHETEAQLASYVDLAGFIRRSAAEPEQDAREELFRRMVLNVLVGNTDDHARNHAFFWDGRAFRLTPAFDVCPDLRAGRTAFQAMAIGAEGRRSTVRNARSEAAQFGLTATDADQEVDRLVELTRAEWPVAAELAGLTSADRERLERETVLGPGCFE